MAKCTICGGNGVLDEAAKCWSCEGSGHDTEYVDHPTCPHCGYEQTDDYYDTRDGDWDCPECRKVSTIEVEWSVTFTTRRKD